MSRELFGTDGVRALAGTYPLDQTGTTAIGRAVGTQFAHEGEHVVIACDTRESSQHLVELLTGGLRAVGVHVVFAGVIPTPGLAYITAQHPEFVAGVMVTASHNPYEYNGVKVFSPAGGKLTDAAEERLNTDIEQGVPDRLDPRHSGLDPESSLEIHEAYAQEYEDFLVASAGDVRLEGMKLVVDTAHGAASGIGQRVFTRLGAEVTALGDTPDGRNINVDCGATNTLALRSAVVDAQATLGIAVDGDADRLMMVDGEGRECTGDHLLYLLAVGNGYRNVVATVMTNLGAEQSMAARGISLERTGVGDRYVLERLIETGYHLGGEQSGHIILPDITTTGDGLLAAVQVLRVLQASGKPLASWRDEVELLPQCLVNFRIADKMKLNSPEVTDYVQVKTAALGTTGRILVRPSGTEPLARVMVEAPNAEALAQEMAQHIEGLVQ